MRACMHVSRVCLSFWLEAPSQFLWWLEPATTCGCSPTVGLPKGNGGFNGGLMDYAFDFFKSVTDYIYISGASGLMSTIILQPVSVAVEADQTAVQSYSGGIVSSDSGTNLDHGVLAVCYDSAAGYYLVKNSWGASWGDGGYLKISTTGNLCSIISQPYHVTTNG